jgi:hypothetical protein
MDLFALVRTIWRHKIAAAPVILLMGLGLFYVVAIKPPTYDSDASVQLLYPPAAPTPQQIAQDPKLGKLNANNPFVSLGDPLFVGDAVVDEITSPSAQQQLLSEGVDKRYQAAMSSDPGNPPIIDITGVGKTQAIALYGAQKVTALAQADLIKMQAADGVNPVYMITSEVLIAPTQASATVTSKLRTLIAVLGGGIILLFVVISGAEAIERKRADDLEDVPSGGRHGPVGQLESRDDRDAFEHTQEFSSPFLQAASRRPVPSLPEARSVRSGRPRPMDLDGSDDDDLD